jgi:hypothetical protein
MRIAVLVSIFSIFFATHANAQCAKEDVCKMIKKMSPFSVLDKCPSAGPLIVQCKKIANLPLEKLPDPEFVDNGDGTVTDKTNKLLWIKKGINKDGEFQQMDFRDAERLAESSKAANKTGWRLPTLAELNTLLHHERVKNASGKKSWVNPVFDDDRGHHYWTTTSCEKVTFIKDRYQKKICQEGTSAVWLVHFNVGALFWQFKNKKIYHVWLVQSL